MAEPHVLLTGASGYLGRHLRAALQARAVRCTTLGRADADVICDLTQDRDVKRLVERVRPTHVLNAAAMSTVGACEKDPARAMNVNAWAIDFLATGAGTRLLQVSTDMVFDGKAAPYGVAAEPQPLSVYGQTKRRGEELALRYRHAVVVRLPLLFGPSHDGQRGATDMIRSALGKGAPVALFANEFRTPLHVADAAFALVELLLDASRTGIEHLAGPERVSRTDLGFRFMELHGLTSPLVRSGAANDPLRPRDASLVGDWRAPRSLDAMLRDS